MSKLGIHWEGAHLLYICMFVVRVVLEGGVLLWSSLGVVRCPATQPCSARRAVKPQGRAALFALSHILVTPSCAWTQSSSREPARFPRIPSSSWETNPNVGLLCICYSLNCPSKWWPVSRAYSRPCPLPTLEPYSNDRKTTYISTKESFQWQYFNNQLSFLISKSSPCLKQKT